jgi:hypothetical protein
MSSPLKANTNMGRNQLGFVEVYLERYDAVLRERVARNGALFTRITALGQTAWEWPPNSSIQRDRRPIGNSSMLFG